MAGVSLSVIIKKSNKNKDNSKVSNSKENILFIFTEILYVFIFFIKVIWHIIKFIIDGIGYSLIFILKVYIICLNLNLL